MDQLLPKLCLALVIFTGRVVAIPMLDLAAITQGRAASDSVDQCRDSEGDREK